MVRRGRSRPVSTLKVRVPRGVPVRVQRKKTKKNPVTLEFGGEKRKYHLNIGYKRRKRENDD